MGKDNTNAGINFTSFDAAAGSHDLYGHTSSMAGDPAANGTLVQAAASPTASHFWSGRTGGTLYFFQVISKNGGDVLSNEISFTTAPKEPTTFTAVPGGNPGEVDVAWVLPADGTRDNVKLYWKKTADPTFFVQTLSGTAIDKTLQGLAEGVLYDFEVTSLSTTNGESDSPTAVSTTATAGAGELAIVYHGVRIAISLAAK